MSDAKPLRILDAFGPDLEHALLLAVHPDETHDSNGDPVASRRTFLLSLAGGQASFVEERAAALTKAWYSSSGAAYLAEVESDALWVKQGKTWTREKFAERPVSFVRFLWGIPGKAPGEDLLFISAQEGIFIRTTAGWRKHSAPGEGFPYQIHGRKADEVYVGGDQLVVWDGSSLAELEAPEDDSVTALWVTEDDRLLGGNAYLSIATASGNWERIETEFSDFEVLTGFGSSIYAATFDEGVIRVYPGDPVRETEPFEVDKVVALADGMIAPGEPHSMMYDGTSWSRISVPTCEVGKKAPSFPSPVLRNPSSGRADG